MHRWIRILLLCVCSVSARAESPRPFTVQLTAEPASLDPSLVEDGLSLRVLNLVLRGRRPTMARAVSSGVGGLEPCPGQTRALVSVP